MGVRSRSDVVVELGTARASGVFRQLYVQSLGEDGADLKKVPTAKQKLALKRHHMLSTSYREHVGHKRPGAPKNPMPLAEALEKAAALEKQIRE